jgi:hypothetical protein
VENMNCTVNDHRKDPEKVVFEYEEKQRQYEQWCTNDEKSENVVVQDLNNRRYMRQSISGGKVKASTTARQLLLRRSDENEQMCIIL